MESHKLHILAARFWQGEVSEREEAMLREAVRYGKISPELEPLRHYFDAMEAEKAKRTLDDDFDRMILARIAEKKEARIRPMMLLRMAATLVLLLGLGYVFMQKLPENNQAAPREVKVDSYSSTGPAYEQVKAALFKMSVNLNVGIDATAKVGKFDQVKSEMNDSR